MKSVPIPILNFKPTLSVGFFLSGFQVQCLLKVFFDKNSIHDGDLSVDIRIEDWYTRMCIHWGVAKSVRHGTLTPACVGSSPAAPANFL